MLFNIEGKKILITGSTSGLGLVLAEGLAREGASVILNGRNPEKVEEVVQSFLKLGLKASGYAFDISKADEVERQMTAIEKDHGLIDVLFISIFVITDEAPNQSSAGVADAL